MRGPVIGVLAVLAVAAGPPSLVELRRGKLAGAVSTTDQSSAPQAVTPATRPVTPALRDFLDAYWKGDFAIVRRDVKSGGEIAALVANVRVWILTTAVRTWREGGLVLILDLADGALRLPQPNPRAASQLIALGYDEITRKPDKDNGDQELDRAFEHRWHEAAVGILEGAHDRKQILEYVTRLENRYETGLPARFWLARGFALSLSEASDRTVAAFDRAARDPGLRAEASARAATEFITMQRPRDALRRLDLAGDPGSDLALASRVPFLRGLAFAALGEYEQALVAFEQAAALNPDSVTVRQARTRTMKAAGRKTDDVDDRKSTGQDAWAAMATGDFRWVPGWLEALKTDLRTAARPNKERTALFEMFDQYLAGGHRSVVDALLKGTSLERLSLDLRNSADAWIKESGEEAQAQREMVVATVALEAAHARGGAEWPRAQLILEWACDRLRARLTPTEAERAWMWAAAVLMEGVVQGAALEVHVNHALKRFPGDPALTMARALATEIRAGPDSRSRGDLEPPSADQLELLVHRLKQAASSPDYRMEAYVRLGYTALRQRRHADALELLQPATAADDAFLRYLAHLFRGRALDAQKRFADAIAEYEAALKAAPGAQTAEIALAAALARAGRRGDAAALAETSLTRAESHVDPWLAYGQGDLRKWPDIIATVRETIR